MSEESFLYSLDFLSLINDFKSGISIKDRKYLMKKYRACFIGAEAVKWLKDNKWAKTTNDAITIGNILLKMGIFSHVTNAHEFQNKHLFYKFEDEIPEQCKNKYFLQYRFEEAIQIIKNVCWMATIRKINTTNDIKLLQIYEGLFCNNTDRAKLLNCYISFSNNPHPNIIPLDYWEVKKNECIFVYPFINGICLLPGLSRYYNFRMDNNNPLFLYNMIRNIIKQVINALLHCHSLGFAYGRLIASNILITEDKDHNIKVNLTGLGYSLASQVYRGIYIKDCNFIAPESNPLKTVSSKLFSENKDELTSQELLSSIGPCKVNDYNDTWSVGILLCILLCGENPYPLWDIRDRYNLLDKEDSILSIYTEEYFFTKHAHDLLSKLLEINPTDRIPLKDVLQHPFFTTTDQELLNCNKDWFNISNDIIQRWNSIWPSLHQQSISNPKNQISALSKYNTIQYMKHITSPFQVYNPDSNTVRKILVFGLDKGEVDLFMSNIIAEYTTAKCNKDINPFYEDILYKFLPGTNALKLNELSDSVIQVQDTFIGNYLPSEVYYNNQNIYHFTKLLESKNTYNGKIDKSHIPLSFLNSYCILYVSTYENNTSIDSLSNTIITLFNTSNISYSFSNNIHILVVMLGWPLLAVDCIKNALQQNPFIKVITLIKEKKMTIPHIISELENMKRITNDNISIYKTSLSLQIIGINNKIESKIFKTIQNDISNAINMIEILDFRYCKFTLEQWELLLSNISLLLNNNLSHLQFSNCPLNSSMIISLLTCLASSSKIKLKTLILTNINCDNIGATYIAQYITKRDCTIEILDLSYNNLIDKGSKIIFQGVRLNNSIKTLRLCNVNMGSIGANYISFVLQRNICLKYLDITHNPIGPWSLLSFYDALFCSGNQSLCYFYYSYSSTQEKQHIFIQTRLSYNRSLMKKDCNLYIIPTCMIRNSLSLYHQGFCCKLSSNIAIRTDNLLKSNNVLVRIVLSSLNLDSIPPLSSKYLPGLQELVLSNNKIKTYSLCDSIANQLKILDLSFNILKDIPENLQTHINLESLYISRNDICNANGMKYLLSLKKLKILDLSGNWINTIPINTLYDFPKLGKIMLMNNSMYEVKSRLYEIFFMKLYSFDLSSCELDSLPNDFIYLNNNLKLLNLARNKFSISPPQLLQLTNLNKLILKQNEFKSKKDIYFGECSKSLKILVSESEFDNEIKLIKRKNTIKSVFSISSGTSNIFINDNTINIRNSLERIELPKNTKDHHLIKIVHIGNDNYLVKYIFDNLHNIGGIVSNIKDLKPQIEKETTLLPFRFCQCTSAKRHTIFHNISFELESNVCNRYSMWNFCGPDILSLKFFRNNSAIYILYFDNSKSLESQIIQHLQLIHATCDIPYIILVGYTPLIKKNTQMVKSAEQLTKELDILTSQGFKSISFLLLLDKDKDSIQQLLDFIIKLSKEAKELSQIVNTQDRDLIELISQETKFTIPPIITYNDISLMAKSCCIKDYHNPKPIVRYLNSIGRVIYIDDQKLGLTDTIILNHDWIVNACNELFSTNIPGGILPLSKLSDVWKEPCFPDYILDKIYGILIKNEIVCKLLLPGHPPSLLIPCMLEKKKPVIYDVWPSLQDYIYYKDLYNHPQPELGRLLSFKQACAFDFFSRLIFRLFHIATPLRYWINGIIIEKYGCICLIEHRTIHDIHFRFRLSNLNNFLKLPSFIRIVLETVKQLIEIYRVPHEFFVSYMCPSSGINKYFKKSESTVYQDLVQGQISIKGNEYDEIILYADIAPDILLVDMNNFHINIENINKGKAVGKGSYGTVYEGIYNNRQVAIKELQIKSNITMETFSREVWMSANLKHPSIAELIGFSWKPLSLILEFIPHGDLYEFLHNDKNIIDWSLRLKIAYDIASAMNYLHTRDPIIVHRDLKTPNCLISGFSPNDITVKVTDLGESIVLAESYTGRDNLQNPTWMAPEILRNESYDQLSDVYSFAIILWELLVRKYPFSEYPEGNSPFKSILEDAIIDGLRPSIPKDCPKEYSKLIKECWKNDPQKRLNFTQIVKRIQEMIDKKITN